MTIPNILTLIRIILTPVLVWLLLDQRIGHALVVFFVAGVTDGLDGLIARVFHQKSKLGAYLDPLADKLLLVSSFILLGYLGMVPNWVAIIAVSRDAMIVLGILSLMFHQVRVEIQPSMLSKITTVVQIVIVIVVLGRFFVAIPENVCLALYCVMALLCVTTGFQYIAVGVRMWESQRDNGDKAKNGIG